VSTLETDVMVQPMRSDASVAYLAARAAARELLRLRSGLAAPDAKPDEIGRLGDLGSHGIISAVLMGSYPGDTILSEEAADGPWPYSTDRLWIIDPLDGTREFGEAARTDWAVHVALVRHGELVLGVVALPALDEVFTSAHPPVIRPPSRRLRMVVSRTRPPAVAADVARLMDAEMIPMGSAGAKTMAVVLGDADIYLHGGGQHVWDSAAPVAVARAAGLHTSRLDGSPLVYPGSSSWQPDLLVCRPELSTRVLHALRTVTE